MKRKPPPSPFEAQRKAAQRAALNALKRARRSAEKAGVSLSEWEGEFLGSVEERVKPELLAHVREVAGYFTQQLEALEGKADEAPSEDAPAPKRLRSILGEEEG